MIRFLLAAFALGLPAVASAADYYPPTVSSPQRALPPYVAAPPGAVPRPYFTPEREPIGIINLPGFWSEVRKSASVEEVVARVHGRYGSGPIVFQGQAVDGRGLERVVIQSIYQRPEDEALALPAVTVETFHSLEGSPPNRRVVTIPLYPQTSSAYR